MPGSAQHAQPAAAASAPTAGTNLPDMPMTSPPENALAYETAKKPVITSRLLSDMESLDDWEHIGFGSMSLSKDRCHQGQTSLLLTSPTKTVDLYRIHPRGTMFDECHSWGAKLQSVTLTEPFESYK